MTTTLAFDVYGTLINTDGVTARLEEMIGQQAKAFSQAWRNKQLEYSFRRGLMQHYEPFSVCTSQALDYTCARYKLPLSKEQKQALLSAYKTLPAFDDVINGMERLKQKDYKLYAFSNGAAEAVEQLLVAAGIRDYFHGIVSTDTLKSFKPNPGVYAHFLRTTESTGAQAWLISSNPFDVIGSISAGMRSAWIQRSEEAVFDPWGIEPTVVAHNLVELDSKISPFTGQQ